VTINGRFDTQVDHWYRLQLKKGEAIALEVMAQRNIRSPIDSVVEIYNADGKRLAENDDGAPLGHECVFDFVSADSWLAFEPPADGEYFVRIRDQAGVAGPRAVYRLSVNSWLPDFKLHQWPDAVPIWGPGSTASFVVSVHTTGRFASNVDLVVEGLPAGWTSPPSRISCGNFRAYGDSQYAMKALLTITAPADAAPGTVVPFRVVGRATVDGRSIERVAQPQTLLGNGHNDRMHLRHSEQSRAVVARPLDSRVECSVRELKGKAGETVQIPVKIERLGDSKAQFSLTVDGETLAAGCAHQPPQPVAAGQTEVVLPYKISPERAPGFYGIVVSRSWSSDLRGGRPGPCTPLILLEVLPK
jgi:hypothetical protein